MKGQRKMKQETTPDFKKWVEEFDTAWDELELLANGGYGIQPNYKTTMLIIDIVNRYKPFWRQKFGIPLKNTRKNVR